MKPTIERVTESVTLGEGPHWDPNTQSLYYANIIGKSIHKYTPSTNKHGKASTGEKQVTFIIPVDGKQDQFVISLNNELVLISWDGESSDFSVVETLCSAQTKADNLKNVFNDGKCDASGRLWTGTIVFKTDGDIESYTDNIQSVQPLGTLYSLDASKTLKGHVQNVGISNGLAWNYELRKMYYIDSKQRAIDQYDFDINSGTITNKQVIFKLDTHGIPGVPDGMTIDADGNLWVAIFLGGRIIKIDPKNPDTLLDTIHMPVNQVTSVAFGGDTLDELYVTTGAMKSGEDECLSPNSGAVLKITGTSSKGLPHSKFKL